MERRTTDPLTIIAMILTIIGGINWLLVAFGFNLVEAIFGPAATSILTKLIYILVGISAIYLLYPLYQMLTSPRERPVVRP
ncbi:DUF378 domain-containing protein [Methanocella arvoryzae]|uniref:DUF378 domain-containing protein n=1 Tax=Methanocella arvoryzae (strain DSM 22066 / NBRC 105507 / MRE50) TaxID=351160 RepID=Q0W7V6_METAR|nr:DUF378 domain-containing protein [Methanocella arvoryzae]CAJ35537.1 conserved hypothetical protein [Methanocella arvoryzae MRE50]